MTRVEGKLAENEAWLFVEDGPHPCREMGYDHLPRVQILQAGSKQLEDHIEHLQTKNGFEVPFGLVVYHSAPLREGQSILIEFQGHMSGSDNDCLVLEVL